MGQVDIDPVPARPAFARLEAQDLTVMARHRRIDPGGAGIGRIDRKLFNRFEHHRIALGQGFMHADAAGGMERMFRRIHCVERAVDQSDRGVHHWKADRALEHGVLHAGLHRRDPLPGDGPAGDLIDKLFERVDVVAYTLIIGGIIFLFIDKLFHETEENGTSDISVPVALKIGIFQTIALIPGGSRSAASIIGGLTQKLNKKAAAEFSFFLAVPTMFAATAYKLLKFYKEGNSLGTEELTLLAIGNIVAFIVAILAIKSFIGFLTRHGFKVFGYYRIALGLIILVLYYMGIQLSVV